VDERVRRARLYAQKWRWYERNSLAWNRLRIRREFMRRDAFVRWPVHGNLLEAFREGRLEIGAHTLFEPHVWITAPGDARVRIGSGTFLNIGMMVAAHELVEIGDHCMFANGCFITDANHRFDDLEKPVPWHGFTSKGPTRVGDNVWCGANVVITSGVTVGERCVIGAHSVVTRRFRRSRSPPARRPACSGQSARDARSVGRRPVAGRHPIRCLLVRRRLRRRFGL
jgi:acetyltransferase-like isoleucine patch superfamily enzyme